MAPDGSATTGATQTLTSLARTRHSTRAYKPDPVPRPLLEECFEIAQHVSSKSNLQPWRVTVVEGAALQRLEKSLLAAVEANEAPQIAPIPVKYSKYRSAMGRSIYGPDGYNIPRDAREQLETARQRNYTFFDAPIGLIVAMDSALAKVDVLSVGLYLQMLLLLLQERGVSNCIEVSVAGYPRQIREELGIPEDMDILCGVAVGYADQTKPGARIPGERDDWWSNVNFVGN
ncbi:nitroreductase [Paraphaeosphaeria sporulosa]|uniref:Nitroreductase n=1 Tax=Paraphaeosphaeria sporulosa TaxID=1460663 RepID=A0A177CIH2_9PLEO|nr:nitroreductase [Paraphaeosphaeria sporulosa]OAG06587.1 nitroreductase [Paraphaeosphaeria sporulosa]